MEKISINQAEKHTPEEEIELVMEDVRNSTQTLISKIKESEYYKQLIESDPEEAAKKIADLEKGEDFFTKKVLEAAFKAREKYSKGVALFDVDGTLATTRISERTTLSEAINYNTMIRPAALPVLAKLHALGFVTGLLTTRGPRERLINEALSDKRNLFGVRDFIDATRVYTTKDTETKEIIRKSGIHEMSSDIEPLYQYHLKKGLIRADLPQREKDTLAASGYFEKCMLVADVKSNLDDDTALLITDDERYPHLFDESNGVYGVELAYGGKDGGAFMIDKKFINL